MPNTLGVDSFDASIAPFFDSPRDGRRTVSAVRSLVAMLSVIATALGLLFEAPALVAVWQGAVTYGFSVNVPSMTIDFVQPGQTGSGIRVGMHVVPNGASAWRLTTPEAGDRMTVTDGVRNVTATAHRAPVSQAEQIFVTVTLLGSFAITIFAGILCYERPGVMTAAFLCFALADIDAGWVAAFYDQFPEAVARPIDDGVRLFLGGWTYYPLVWFALRFPNDKLRYRSMRVADYLWTATALAAIVWFGFFVNAFFARLGDFWAFTVPQNAPIFVAIGALAWVYIRATDADRQRAAWAITGLVASLIFGSIGDVLGETSGATLFIDAIQFVAAMSPLALVYSVVRYQLLDISFVVNRALVYSAVTGFIIGTVALADYVIGKFLSQTRVTMIVEAGATVGVGYALHYVHAALERLVDRVVFASRHAAEKHIERVAAALAYARSRHGVLSAMVDEPRLALDLQSSGVFIVREEKLELAMHHGWHVAGEPKIDLDDPLARLLLSERKIIDIAESRWHASIAGFAPGSLQIAVPLFSRHDLIGVAFFGRHRNGSALDFEERALLQRLCHAASVAYEAVELAEAREELSALRATRNAHRSNVGKSAASYSVEKRL